MNKKTLKWVVVALSILGGWQYATGQQQRDLRMKFNTRSLEFRLTVRELQNAYTVTPSGDIRLHAPPPSTLLADDVVEVSVAEGPASGGTLTVRRSGQTHNVVVRPDNSLGTATILTGPPFGYSFLPREGTVQVGDSWRQEFPAPERGEGVRASAAYRYTFHGARPAPGCADCDEIEIQGVRRFLAGPALDRMLKAADRCQFQPLPRSAIPAHLLAPDSVPAAWPSHHQRRQQEARNDWQHQKRRRQMGPLAWS